LAEDPPGRLARLPVIKLGLPLLCTSTKSMTYLHDLLASEQWWPLEPDADGC
jgi:hypothetical protein